MARWLFVAVVLWCALWWLLVKVVGCYFALLLVIVCLLVFVTVPL